MKKKIIGIASALVLTAFAGVGCGKSEADYVYFGLGNYASSEVKGATVQTDIYAAAVLFDQDGKMLDVKIDVMQATVRYKDGNNVESSLAANRMNDLASGDYKTKWELGDLYGMKPISEANGIGKEWFEQMGAYQKYAEGKTLDQVKSAGYKVGNATHLLVPTAIAGVSITTEGYLNVLELAWNNRVAVKVSSAKDLQNGLGLFSSVSGKKLEVTIAGAIFDKNDVVLAARHDVYQVPFVFDGENVLLGTGKQVDGKVIKSKHVLGPEYGMYYVPAATVDKATTFFNGKVYEKTADPESPASIGEWYEQANALVAYLVGKKVADVKAQVNTTTNKFGDALASVTVKVNTYVKAYEKALAVAKDANR